MISLLILFSKNELFSLRTRNSLIFPLNFSAFSPLKIIEFIIAFSFTTILNLLFSSSTDISEKKVDAVFAYGNLSQHIIHAMNGSNCFYQFYSDKNLLITDLKEYLHDGDVIYIKGSRGMKMEDIITGLKS